MSEARRPDPLEPLYAPWEEPTRYRVRPADERDTPIRNGRRKSDCLLVPYLRQAVSDWRHAGYHPCSETTRTLLNYWFETAHPSGFRYHFAQREAVETMIWLYEVARYRLPSEMFASVLPEDHRDYAKVMAVPDAEDLWPRYCAKIATGGGKTKVMSLLIAWSYFHSLFEPDSPMARHFVLIAPNLIVFDRLITDFASSEDSPWVFDTDPILPPEWRDDFNVEVVLQDQPGGGSYKGTIYLTNIHRLYPKRDRKDEDEEDYPAWGAPKVKPASVYKSGEALRKRISEHPGIMVLNDEAHHLWDPESEWNNALRSLHDQSKTKGNAGIVFQGDFTATPRQNDGSLFKHVVCDFPLGEAVDAGIVKVPVIGRSKEIKKNEAAADAFEEYRTHLLLGYKQYEYAFEEWSGSFKPILFVMCENAQKANEIASKLNKDHERFPLIAGKVLNLHTRLEGKIVKRRVGSRTFEEFVPDESGKKIRDDDLKIMRQWSKELDSPDSPYKCVVSVLMLREGWDVKNVTTIVPLRKYEADSNILAEQTLGRGLRRMTAPGSEVNERVTVVEHPAFTKFYQTELELEGVDVPVVDLDGAKPQSQTIFVDFKNKPFKDLELEIPLLSDAIETFATLSGLTFEDVKEHFERERYHKLPVNEPRSELIRFEERTMFTDEVVKVYEIDRGLLAMGATAISVYVRVLEKACRIQGAHGILSPILIRFIEEVLFERPVQLFSGEVDHRMGDADVRNTIEATFTKLIRNRTHKEHKRERKSDGVRLSIWKNFQATYTPLRPCVPAERTMFNLVPCANAFEAEFADFLDACSDVVAFAKNAGPQKLCIDYLAPTGRQALYWPDFLVRLKNGNYVVVEVKGQEDVSVAYKAKAAVDWCETASLAGAKWSYLYVTQPIFDQNNEFSIGALARACLPKLKSVLSTLETRQPELPLEATPVEIREDRASKFLLEIGVSELPADLREEVVQAINQLEWDCRMGHKHLQAAFSLLWPVVEELCGTILKKLILPRVPHGKDEQRYYFQPYLDDLPDWQKSVLAKNQHNLRKNVLFDAYNNRAGNLLHCLAFASEEKWVAIRIAGLWEDVREVFSARDLQVLKDPLDSMNAFRGRHFAHGEDELTDPEVAEQGLKEWIPGLLALHAAALD